MLALILVLIVVLLSLLITRGATILLMATGMSKESARFQARSALSGVGFTTSEAEAVVNHPIRRRVILTLMLLGSAGLIAVVASLILSFGGADSGTRAVRGFVLVAGLFLLWLAARSSWVDRRLSALIVRVLRARGLDVRDYVGLLDLSGDYAVCELFVEPGHWVAERTLGELRLREEGVAVLGIHRADGGYVGVPVGETEIEPQDTLVLYGDAGHLQELEGRGKGEEGDAAHVRARAANQQTAGGGEGDRVRTS